MTTPIRRSSVPTPLPLLVHFLGRRGYTDLPPSLLATVAALDGFQPRLVIPRATVLAKLVGDFDRLGNLVLYSVCSLGEMIPEEISGLIHDG